MRKKWLIVLSFLIAVSLIVLLGIKQKPIYRASSTVVVETTGHDTFYFAYKTYMKTQRGIIKSRRVAYHVIKNLGLMNKKEFKTASDPTGILLRKLKVDIIKGTGIIRINAEDGDPKEASRIANEFATVYINPKLSRIQTNNNRVQDFADVPLGPVRPDKNLNIVLSIILIIAGGVSAAFVKKSGDAVVKDPKDITALFQLPVLGSVPKIKPDGKNIKTKADIDMVVKKDSLSMASEAYRSIRAKLLSSLNSAGSMAKSIVITSPGLKEGKTISAINLAVMIAHSGESALLVDAHAKRPRVHAVFNMNNNAGFFDYISGKAEFESIIKYPGIDNLSIVTSGNASYKPIDSISLKNTKLFLEKASAGFSKIIFDGPPVYFFGDIAVLLNICDGTVLVTESTKTAKNLLANSKESLHKRGANILGVVFNNVSL